MVIILKVFEEGLKMVFSCGTEAFIVWSDEGIEKKSWVRIIEDDGRILRFSTERNTFAIPWSSVKKAKIRGRTDGGMGGGEDGKNF